MPNQPPSHELVQPRLRMDELRPYVSLVVARAPEDIRAHELFAQVMLGCLELSKSASDHKRRGPGAEPKIEEIDAYQVGAILVEEYTTPSWTTQADVVDRRNHVIIVFRLANLFAFHCSDPSIRRSISANIGHNEVPGFARLAEIQPEIMNAAFVQGVTRTVWLRGIHRPTSLKSDTKTLSGLDLGDALDPLGDQSYHFTAVRCQFDSGEFDVTIGISPFESRIWISRASSWDAFKVSALVILARIAETHNPSFAPIRFLAIPGDGGKEVKDAFDVGLYPPEMLEGGADNDAFREERERIAERFSFDVSPLDGPDLHGTILLDGETIGALTLRFDISNPMRVVCHSTTLSQAPDHADDVRLIERYCENGEMLIVRYDSEHVISGNVLYRSRFRDHSFGGYQWADFSNWNITREKPSSLERIGEEDSLFCWVWWRWGGLLSPDFSGGWLACDDGPGEKADFLYFDEDAQVVSLIHVKASDTDSDRRSVAVARYEVVVSQAIKNLRYLDRENLRAGLLARIEENGPMLTWYKGEPCGRADFVNALSRIQPRCEREIVVVQPHLQKAIWDRTNANPESRDAGRLRQLSTLLIGAEASCRALGARLVVFGSDGI